MIRPGAAGASPDPNEAVLQAELEFYARHRAEWLEKHSGQFVLIGKQTFGGFYGSYQEALLAGARAFGLVAPFLIRELAEHDPNVSGRFAGSR